MTSQTSITTETTVSQNGTAQNEPPQPPPPPASSSSEIDKFLIANTSLAIWLIFLAIGGGILALYYSGIDYLPEIEWKQSLIYLFIGSIVGGAIGLLLTLSLLIPGVLWSHFIIRDPCIDFSLHTGLSSKEADEDLCIRTVVQYLGWPFLKFLLLSHLFLLVGKGAYWFFAAGILVLTFWQMRKSFTSLVKTMCDGEVDAHSFKYAAWFTLSVFLSQVTMYVIYWLSDTPGAISWQTGAAYNLGIFGKLTILCTAGVWLSNNAVAVLYQKHPRGAIAASLLAAGLLLFTADHFSKLSVKLMNHYGFGYYERFNVLISADGDSRVNALGVKPCSEKVLCNVEILSKIGDQYYLRVGDTDYVTLPKADVVAMRRLK
ncbi:MAG TPA: hypothetical protein VN844_17370 [Pyrinomonadaceae bacterium]|nr:hypothetical protein [Pyrinomonadaceae bacterium]